MTWVDARAARSRTIPAARDRVWAEVSDVERLAELIPKVEHAEPVGDGWRWTITEHGALGYTVRPAFTVAIEETRPAAWPSATSRIRAPPRAVRTAASSSPSPVPG